MSIQSLIRSGLAALTLTCAPLTFAAPPGGDAGPGAGNGPCAADHARLCADAAGPRKSAQ